MNESSRANRARLGACSAMQAMLVLDNVWFTCNNAFLRTRHCAFAASYAIGGNTIATPPNPSAIQRINTALNRLHAQIEIIEGDFRDLENDPDASSFTRINVRQIRLLLEDTVDPFLLFVLGSRPSDAAHTDHFIEPRMHHGLKMPIRQKLLGHLLPTSREEVHGIGFVMDGAHATNLWQTRLIDGCHRQRSSKLHFLHAYLRIHCEPLSLPSLPTERQPHRMQCRKREPDQPYHMRASGRQNRRRSKDQPHRKPVSDPQCRKQAWRQQRRTQCRKRGRGRPLRKKRRQQLDSGFQTWDSPFVRRRLHTRARTSTLFASDEIIGDSPK